MRLATATPVELLRALAVLGEPPTPAHARVAGALGLDRAPTPAEYTEAFVLGVAPYASVHLGAEGMMGGEARARVAGFWRALGHDVPAEPDHLSALLGLWAHLAEAEEGADRAERLLAARAREALLHEHLASWAPAVLERVADGAPGPLATWADLLGRVLEQEVRLAPAPDALPLQLREAPPLADPRRDGGEALLRGLLAPVRCGIILTRADLSRLARALGLGAGAGARRQVLEHLLELEPAGVLGGLAAHARRGAAAHARREPWLGEVAHWWRMRARATAALLDELAHEAESTGTGGAPKR